VKQVVQAEAADRKAGEELAEYDEPDRSVDKLEDGAALDKRGRHQENDGQNIEQQKSIPKPDGTPVLPLVQLLQARHVPRPGPGDPTSL
jgi:hypothetical protein